jgi:hypothetical protein
MKQPRIKDRWTPPVERIAPGFAATMVVACSMAGAVLLFIVWGAIGTFTVSVPLVLAMGTLAVLQSILAGPFLSDGRSWSPLRRWLFVASFFAGSLLAFAIAVWVVGPIPPET